MIILIYRIQYQIGDGSPLKFSGAYCQFNPLSCPQARDDKGVFKPCAGMTYMGEKALE